MRVLCHELLCDGTAAVELIRFLESVSNALTPCPLVIMKVSKRIAACISTKIPAIALLSVLWRRLS